MATIQSVQPIAAGFHYAIRLQATGPQSPAFPFGCELMTEVRAYVGAPVSEGILSTANQTIIRVDDDTIELHFPSSMTGGLTNSVAVIDLVRTDPSPDQWMSISVQIPLVRPVTQPGADA
ncbi:hypothetical protein [Sphingomonas sp. CARO-RG-8B-R24-01]|uniref:hypothetical protein n=1 Tax=Sphingomonas sp. CARO-RG-8B-R24-01 TaxID=2914831 RepID=UPI001F58A025|nr:hypothetical protein [Sphingomonas sp. CARO-RG-8B-R24-01]